MIIVDLNFLIDIDECLDDNGGCDQQCTNTDGSYDCSCDAGYSLGSNNKACNGKIIICINPASKNCQI